jgi:predicted nucleotidyltransferase
MHEWPAREAASRLRLWPELEELIRRVDESDDYEAAVLLGSLARGEGDEFSDIDLLLVVRDDCWQQAWAKRHRLSSNALYVWDELAPGRELAKHAWLTRDFVLVECPHTTRAGGHRLADPFVVIAGNPAATNMLPRRSVISGEELQQHVDERDAAGTSNEVQRRYDDLVRALRHG